MTKEVVYNRNLNDGLADHSNTSGKNIKAIKQNPTFSIYSCCLFDSLASAALASASAALASASAALALASSLSSLSIFSKGDSFWRVKSRPAETCPEGKEDNARGGKEGNIRIEGGNLRETVGNKRPREEDSNRAGFNKPLRIITKPRRQAAYPSAESATTAQIE